MLISVPQNSFSGTNKWGLPGRPGHCLNPSSHSRTVGYLPGAIYLARVASWVGSKKKIILEPLRWRHWPDSNMARRNTCRVGQPMVENGREDEDEIHRAAALTYRALV